ncbi:MAG: FAD-dependent oxidoreductase, partial [Ignisphaera sp.]
MSKFKIVLPREVEGVYDCVVVGAGPAGLTATLYLARLNVKVIVVSRDIGGQMATAPIVDDYPGIPSVPGAKLAEMFEEHVRRYGVPIVVGDSVRSVV